MNIRLFLLCFFSASLLFVPAGLNAGEAELSNRNILRFAAHVSGIGNMDPHQAAGSQDRAFADMVFNGLLRYRPGQAPNIEPDLADRIPDFTMINGRQVWTVVLKRNVMFHSAPGVKAHELTADDVIFSLQKAADSEYSTSAGEYEGISVEKISRYKVKIIPEKPLSPVLFLPKLTDYSGGCILSRKAFQTMGHEEFRRHPVGTGPFAFKRLIKGEKVILAAHESYFRGRPKLDGVEIHFIADTKERTLALKQGKVDVIMGSGSKGWIDDMALIEDIKLDFHGVGESIILYFNTKMKPLNDIRVRKAIAYALDREAFIETSNKLLVEKIYSLVPEQLLPGGLAREDAARFDLLFSKNLEKARALMAEAGFPDGFTLDLVSSEKRLYRSCYQSLADQLEKIGIHCRIRTVPHSDMHQIIRKDPKPLVIYVSWRPNAQIYLNRSFHSDSIVVTGRKPSTNFSHYSKVDKLIEDARLEIDPEKQINLWEQAQIRILSDIAAYPLMFTRQVYARRSYVDYGHPLSSTMALYPQFTENTRIIKSLTLGGQ